MKIPLLVHVKPEFPKCGPLVYLLSGVWEIESNHEDSHLVVALSPEQESRLEHGMKIDGGTSIRLYIRKAGNEKHITVYAKRLQ